VLFQSLEAARVRPCVLRNYEGFPTSNIGNDIDFLISPSDLPRALRAIRSLNGIRIVGYAERSYVASVFLEGISRNTNSCALEIDFDLSLTWKGLPFLSAEAVLEAAIPRSAGNAAFFTPSPVHEAIISLFASLLIGGWLKEKYFPQVQHTFAGNSSKVIAALSPQFGLMASTHLVDAVIKGNRQRLLACVRPLRRALLLRSLWHRPVRSIFAILRHYASEFAFRYSPQTLETVLILASNGCEKTKVIDALISRLHSVAARVEKRMFRPRLPIRRKLQEIAPGQDSHALVSRSSFVFMAYAVLWMMVEWLSQFAKKKSLTLEIRESCYHDLLINSHRSPFSVPMRFARFIGKFIPSPVLLILLDPAAEGLQSNYHELPSGKATWQLEAIHFFVKARIHDVILDTSQPADIITEGAYAAIIDQLAQRADRKLGPLRK